MILKMNGSSLITEDNNNPPSDPTPSACRTCGADYNNGAAGVPADFYKGCKGHEYLTNDFPMPSAGGWVNTTGASGVYALDGDDVAAGWKNLYEQAWEQKQKWQGEALEL